MKCSFFQKEKGGSYFFNLRSNDGSDMFTSLGFPTLSECEEGLNQALKSIHNESKFKLDQSDDKKFYYDLLSDSGNSLGSSVKFSSEGAREFAIKKMLSISPAEIEIISLTGASSKLSSVSSNGSKEFVTGSFNGHDFVGYQSAKDNKYYFNFSRDGEVILTSEAYNSQSACENGIQSVIQNSVDPDKYEINEAKDGRYYFNLKAGNGQIIGRSKMFKTREQIGGAAAFLAGATAGANVPPVSTNDDDSFMEGKPNIKVLQTGAFSHMNVEMYQNLNDKQYYFHFLEKNGRPILVSEGYTAKAGAQNGINSVIKNATNPDNYDLKKSPDGKCYFNIKSGNGQIVGTSLAYDTESELQDAINVFGGSIQGGLVSGETTESITSTTVTETTTTETTTTETTTTETTGEDSGIIDTIKKSTIVGGAIAGGGAIINKLTGDDGDAEKKAAEAKLAEEKAIEAKLAAEKKKRLAEEKLAVEKKAAEAKLAAEKKAAEEKLAAEKKAAEAKLAAEKKALEEKRLAEEKLAAEKKAAEAKLAAEKKALEEKRLAEEKLAAEKKAAEAKLAAEKKALEEKRLAQEKKLAEEKRLAQEKKLAEERRLAAEKKLAEQKRLAAANQNDNKKVVATGGKSTAGASGTSSTTSKAVGGATAGGAAAAGSGASGGGSGCLKWLFPLLFLLLLGALALWFFRDGCNAAKNVATKTTTVAKDAGTKAAGAVTETVDKTKEVVGDAANATKDAVTNADATKDAANAAKDKVEEATTPAKALGKNGGELGLKKGSLEYQMADFLSDPNSRAPKTFIMETISWPKNSPRMNNKARAQIGEMAKVMKEYPNFNINITGYRQTGEPETYNHQGEIIGLDDIRARCVYRKLEKKGISGSRMNWEGKDINANRNLVEVIITKK